MINRILIASCLLVCSCSKPKRPELIAYKGVPLLISSETYNNTLDSLTKVDFDCQKIKFDGSTFFRVKNQEGDFVYYSYLLASYRNNIATEYTIAFKPDPLPSYVFENLKGEGSWLDNWGNQENTMFYDLMILLSKNLSFKYGEPAKSDTSTLEYGVLYSKTWEKDGLQITLNKKTDNYPNSAFAFYTLIYKPTSEYYEKYKDDINEMFKTASVY